MKAIVARLVALFVLLVFVTGCTEQSGTLTGPEPDDQETTLWSAKTDVEPPALLNTLQPGEITPFLSFPYGQSPEGIAVDPIGNLYVSVRHHGPDGGVIDNLVPDSLSIAEKDAVGVLRCFFRNQGRMHAAENDLHSTLAILLCNLVRTTRRVTFDRNCGQVRRLIVGNGRHVRR